MKRPQHVYVLEFGPVIKVGRTGDPMTRTSQMDLEARRAGVVPRVHDGEWFSGRHIAAASFEAALLRWCRAHLTPAPQFAGRREWFDATGVGFHAVCDQARVVTGLQGTFCWWPSFDERVSA